MAIRTLIVDDEVLARERIRDLLTSYRDFEIVGECGSGSAAVEMILRQQPEVIFLDVQMPEVDGFGVIEAVGASYVPVVIFVTAYDRYALRAFDAHALDYLLKPFDSERFDAALTRAQLQVEQHRSGKLNRQLIDLLAERKSETATAERVVVKSGGRVFFLKWAEVDWIEAASNYVGLHVGKQTHLLRETMSGLEAKLDGKRFLRIHRSVIVNIERVKELSPLFHGEYAVILEDGTQLTLSRGYKDRLRLLCGEDF